MITVQREVETVTTEFQEVYFKLQDINCLFPYKSAEEVKMILQMEEHPEHKMVRDTLINDNHHALTGILIDMAERTKTVAARIEIE